MLIGMETLIQIRIRVLIRHRIWDLDAVVKAVEKEKDFYLSRRTKAPLVGWNSFFRLCSLLFVSNLRVVRWENGSRKVGSESKFKFEANC